MTTVASILDEAMPNNVALLGGLNGGYIVTQTSNGLPTGSIDLRHVSDVNIVLSTYALSNTFPDESCYNGKGDLYLLTCSGGPSANNPYTLRRVTQANGTMTVTAIGSPITMPVGTTSIDDSWLSPDGTEILVQCFPIYDWVRIDTATGALIWTATDTGTFAGHSVSVYAYMGNNRIVTRCSDHGDIELWNGASGTLLDSVDSWAAAGEMSLSGHPDLKAVSNTTVLYSAMHDPAVWSDPLTIRLGLLSTANNTLTWEWGPFTHTTAWPGDGSNWGTTLSTWGTQAVVAPEGNSNLPVAPYPLYIIDTTTGAVTATEPASIVSYGVWQSAWAGPSAFAANDYWTNDYITSWDVAITVTPGASTALDAFVHRTIYRTDYIQMWGALDGGYMAYVDDTLGIKMSHVDAPDVAVSSVPFTSSYNERSTGAMSSNGVVYVIYNSSAGDLTYELIKLTQSYGQLIKTTLNGNIAGLNDHQYNAIMATSDGSMIVTAYYHSPNGYIQGFDGSTGAIKFNINFTALGHASGGVTNAPANNRIITLCFTHQCMELWNTETLTIIDTMPYTLFPDGTALYDNWAWTTCGTNLSFVSGDMDTDSAPKKIWMGVISTVGDTFSWLWGPRILQTSWQTYESSDWVYPATCAWAPSNRVFLVPQERNGSGFPPTWPVTPYLVDTLTGKVSAGEPSTKIGGSIGFWSGGGTFFGFAGPDYVVHTPTYSDFVGTVWRIVGETTQTQSIYYRTLLTDGDSLRWRTEEREITTNWNRGIEPRASGWRGKLAIGPGQVFAGSNDISPMYWVDTNDGAVAESDIRQMSWLLSIGSQMESTAPGKDWTATRHYDMDTVNEFEQFSGEPGTIVLWGPERPIQLPEVQIPVWHLRWSSDDA